MLKLGVAQPSTSLLALSVVLVTRKIEEFTSVWTILSKTKTQNSMPCAKDIHETIGFAKVQLNYGPCLRLLANYSPKSTFLSISEIFFYKT